MDREQARKLLGVGLRATQDEVRAAYRAMLKRAHPDHGGSDEMLRMVLEAYEQLDENAAHVDKGFTASAPMADRLEITPVIAMVGGRVTTRLPDGRRVSVYLPQGLRQGDKVKVKDLVMSVTIKGRREMFVSGDDLCMMVRTTAQVMLEGGRVTVKMPAGPKTLWVSRPADSNHIVRVMGQGLPATRRHKQGSLILKLVPERGPKESRLRAKVKKFATDWAPA